ncbi:MAG: hypothetical protein PSX79_01850 [bacterium]|nr:hypothetical protein [bacterium]
MLFKRLVSVFVFATLTACSPKPAEETAAKHPAPIGAAAKPAADVKPGLTADAADEEPNLEWQSNPGEFEAISPGEVVPFAPPIGVNGEARYLQAYSTTANAFTGDVTLTATPAKDGAVAPVTLSSKLGLKYQLESVKDGGQAAAGQLDWSKIMLTPVKFAYSTGDGKDPTLVFVYKVISETIPRKSVNGGFCPKTGYLAFTTDFARQSDTLTIAAFSDGAWPPEDGARLCGTFNYGARYSPKN